jgi:hypothetical protein
MADSKLKATAETGLASYLPNAEPASRRLDVLIEKHRGEWRRIFAISPPCRRRRRIAMAVAGQSLNTPFASYEH